MISTPAYAAAAEGGLAPAAVERRALRPDDLAVRVDYCGVCHSDLHALRTHAAHSADHAADAGPLVPGHEFVGTVLAVGAAVTAFSPGDPVAVGNIVDSCGACDMCTAEQENFCREFPTLTYGGTDRYDGSTTLGAFSREYVVRDRFAYPLPAGLDPAAVAPLLCAGVTVWEPLRAHSVGRGSRVGVVGLGGLGHLAVKLARALGAEVTVFTTSEAKTNDALALGATRVVVSRDEEAMAAQRGRLDLVLDTVSAAHDLAPYLHVLALDGALSVLGMLAPVTVDVADLLIGRKSLTSGGSGGTRSTRELLAFCGEHGITADVEVLPSAQVQTALERLAANDVRYRFVLDLADLDGADLDAAD
ncbi:MULTISPECIES: NAD(P)-dependent alcohol dehydrogenase [unclassified Rathayibacter]|uniref:NAD(P)-dependent alcohol dehydrogenase n=1 Tax=unclassified Rathayibacter TaxID=2609250 RepID=UPI00104A5CF8|nr:MULTISPECIES: NAD(P)-dependent alcohol dehydrogenase [unclassified Rathayibacter]MCJ1702548.1 NAD(P)-dependent alcohol dehydrogenase [Rathayibacter sp. VKM Ac-2926]TCL85729.1 putative zinc-type alcohol dehydrogenase-like protein [Rathayibacter sp. PhB192]TCM31550.1 putative zinc-type alcohol dehydrogenase-like protein [Rathayibacter sp. PhB179]